MYRIDVIIIMYTVQQQEYVMSNPNCRAIWSVQSTSGLCRVVIVGLGG